MARTTDLSARAATLVTELLPLARVFAGAPADIPADVQAITFRFDDRVVDASLRAGRWSFAVRGPGRGRRPGVHPARLKRDYDAALSDARTLQRQLRGGSVDAATITTSRWLRKLALSWNPERPTDVPAWLRDTYLEDTWADADRTPPRYIVRAALTALPPDKLTTPIRDPKDDAVLTFESEPTDLTWNQFSRGDFVPSDLAARIIGIYHAQPTGRGRRKPLSPSYVQRQKAPSRG